MSEEEYNNHSAEKIVYAIKHDKRYFCSDGYMSTCIARVIIGSDTTQAANLFVRTALVDSRPVPHFVSQKSVNISTELISMGFLPVRSGTLGEERRKIGATKLLITVDQCLTSGSESLYMRVLHHS